MRTGCVVQGIPGRRPVPAHCLIGSQLRRRLTRCLSGDPGVRQVRLAPGRGSAAREDPEAQAGRTSGQVLYSCHQGYGGTGLCPEAAAFSHGTGVRVYDPRRRRDRLPRVRPIGRFAEGDAVPSMRAAGRYKRRRKEKRKRGPHASGRAAITRSRTEQSSSILYGFTTYPLNPCSLKSLRTGSFE